MPALTPPQDGDANRGPALLAIIGTQVAISTICVSLRFYTRIKIGRVGADDWTIMVTLVRGYLMLKYISNSPPRRLCTSPFCRFA